MTKSNNLGRHSTKRYFAVIGLLIQLSFLPLCTYTYGEPIYSSFDAEFKKGLQYYNESKFNLSMSIFMNLSSAYSFCSKCFYYAGKSTGKLASEASWFQATKLARETLGYFQKAYLLNPNDYEIVRDLAEYYQTAPTFLGGNQTKGDALSIKANNLKSILQQRKYD